MKNIFYLILLISLFFSQSCDFKDPSENLNLILDYNVLTTGIGITVVDAATGQPLQEENGKMIKITLLGDDKDLIIEPTGEYHATYDVEIGVLSLAVNPNYTVSETNPVSFQIRVEREGFLTALQSIEVSSEGLLSVEVRMINLETPPDGVTVDHYANVGITSGGVLQSDIVLNSSLSGFDITIPKNTRITDDEGNNLTGNLSIRQIVFSPMDEGALALMPGGMGLFADAIVEDGSEEQIGFYSAGFFNLEITDQNGRKGTHFSNGQLKVTYEVDEDLENSETGTRVKAGDIIPVWSFDEETQKWKYEHDAVFELIGGKLVVTTQLSHLSYWNFDWWYNSPRCSYGATVKFVSDDPNDKSYAWFEGSYYNQQTGRYMSGAHFYGYLNTETRILNAPANTPVTIKFTSGDYRYNLPADVSISNLCSGSYTVNVSKKVEKTVTIHIEGRCNSGDTKVIIKPTFYAYYYDLSTYEWGWVSINQGEAIIKGLTEGHTYRVMAYYNGWQWIDVVYDGTESYDFEVDLPSGICNNF
jgi:hypothetical protein